MKSLHLAIDRIVVEGLPASERRRFIGALEERLREFAQDALPQAIADSARRSIPSLSVGQPRREFAAEDAALQVVNTIRRGLGANGRKEVSVQSGPGRGTPKGNV